MPENIGYGVQSTPRYLDRTSSPQTQVRQTAELESAATAREQRQREQSVRDSQPLESPARPQIISPDSATISQLETSNRNDSLDNANGLGRTAVNSYQSLASDEAIQQLSNRVRVDVQV